MFRINCHLVISEIRRERQIQEEIDDLPAMIFPEKKLGLRNEEACKSSLRHQKKKILSRLFNNKKYTCHYSKVSEEVDDLIGNHHSRQGKTKIYLTTYKSVINEIG